MSTASYGGLSAEQKVFYEMMLLKRAVPPFSHLWLGQEGVFPPTQLPENEGDVINWRVFNGFSAVTTPLTENVTPTPLEISISSTTATVAEYGAFVRYGNKLARMGIDRIAVEASDAMGEQAGDSLDQLVRDVVVAGSTVQFAGAATTRGTVAKSMEVSPAEFLEAVATLKTNKARTIRNGKFVVLMHPHAEYDLLTDSTFQNLLFYSKDRGESNPMTQGYVGDALGCSFYVSPNAKVFLGAGTGSPAADVYQALVVGMDAFGIGGLGAFMPAAVGGGEQSNENNNTAKKVRPLRLITKDFGSAGTEDPLDQRATIGWYTTFVTKRLREAFMVRIEHGSSLGA